MCGGKASTTMTAPHAPGVRVHLKHAPDEVLSFERDLTPPAFVEVTHASECKTGPVLLSLLHTHWKTAIRGPRRHHHHPIIIPPTRHAQRGVPPMSVQVVPQNTTVVPQNTTGAGVPPWDQKKEKMQQFFQQPRRSRHALS